MNAVVVLTRGYTKLEQYSTLIRRNLHISQYLNDKTTKVIIFHEDNIIKEHQEHIKRCTPDLNIVFVCILEHAFNPDKINVQIYAPTMRFSLGYRHMCSFWFVDFWKYVEEYNSVIRIDEDCLIDFSIDHLFTIVKSKTAVFGSWNIDQEYVTLGLNEFTMKFLYENELHNKLSPRMPSGPYTNVVGFNLDKLRQNEQLIQYIECIGQSNCIYTYRWGDLALWGEALTYFCHPTEYVKLDGIKYYHGSHHQYIGNESKIRAIKMPMPNLR